MKHKEWKSEKMNGGEWCLWEPSASSECAGGHSEKAYTELSGWWLKTTLQKKKLNPHIASIKGQRGREEEQEYAPLSMR